jgi:hypothetical protein
MNIESLGLSGTLNYSYLADTLQWHYLLHLVLIEAIGYLTPAQKMAELEKVA